MILKGKLLRSSKKAANNPPSFDVFAIWRRVILFAVALKVFKGVLLFFLQANFAQKVHIARIARIASVNQQI
jgi:hypothetical protein